MLQSQSLCLPPPAHPGEHWKWGLPMPAKRCNFYHVSCVCPVVSSQYNTSPCTTYTHSHAWTTLTWTCLNHLVLTWSRSGSILSLTESSFLLFDQHCLLSVLPRACDHRWSWEHRSSGKYTALVSCSGLSLPQEDSTHYCWHCTNLPVTLPLHSLLTHKQDPEMLKFLSPIWSGQQDDTSCTRSRYKILRPLKPSSPWLHLQILQIKIANRTSDQGQPWLSQTPTKNEFDLLPEMPGKFLQQLTGKG